MFEFKRLIGKMFRNNELARIHSQVVLSQCSRSPKRSEKNHRPPAIRSKRKRTRERSVVNWETVNFPGNGIDYMWYSALSPPYNGVQFLYIDPSGNPVPSVAAGCPLTAFTVQ
jgi:hypothetical protein